MMKMTPEEAEELCCRLGPSAGLSDTQDTRLEINADDSMLLTEYY